MTSNKSRFITLMLCLFLGTLGIHRFYVGKPLTGLLFLLTLGFMGIGAFLDFLVILSGGFTDGQKLTIKTW